MKIIKKSNKTTMKKRINIKLQMKKIMKIFLDIREHKNNEINYENKEIIKRNEKIKRNTDKDR